MSELAAILSAVAGIGILYLMAAAFMLKRLARPGPRAPAERPAVTILKPLHGLEPGLLENLLSFARQDHGALVQVVLGLQNPADPALAVARAVQAACPDRDISIVVDGRLHGTNRKVSNLVNMMEAARHDVIVLADSDMRAGGDYLACVVDELMRPGVGAVTCPYHGLPAGGFWSRISGLGIDTQFLPGVATSVGLGLGHPCMGSTIALTRDTLQRIGGFRAVSYDLADDHVIGARLRALGLSVAVTDFTVAHVCPETSLAEVVAQELRWLRTVRRVEPAGHLGSLVTHPLPFALAALALEPTLLGAAILAAALAARLGVCLAGERAFGLKPHDYWLLPARDCLSFALFVASYLGRGVSWRGHRYEAAPGGALLSKARPDPT